MWGPPRCSGSAHRCQDWQARRRCSWLCLPALPAPSLFSHPLFRRHELQLLQSVKNVKDILQRQEGVTTFTVLGPFWRFSLEPLTSTGAPSNSERKKSQSGGELKCSPLAAPSQAALRERDNRRSSLGSFCRPRERGRCRSGGKVPGSARPPAPPAPPAARPARGASAAQGPAAPAPRRQKRLPASAPA